MKKLKFLLAITTLCVFVYCCGRSDSSTPDPFGYFKIDTTEYETPVGYLMNNGTDKDSVLYYGYKIYLLLHSTSITLQANEDSINEFSGKGNAIGFYLFSTNPEQLDETDYTYYNINSAPNPVGTFQEAYYWKNWDSSLEKSKNRAVEISSGEISIQESGGVYTISYDCTDKYGKNITGEYEGALSIVDRTK